MTYEEYIYEVGRTYVFCFGSSGRARGKVTKRTKKTITVKLTPQAVCHLWGLLTLEEAEDIKPITMRLVDEWANCEVAVTHKAGKRRDETVRGLAAELAKEEL